MKSWIGYGLLAASLVVAYQGYKNSQAEPSTEASSMSVACDVDSQCVLKGERPGTIRTDIFQRRYEWGSTVGPIVVVCRRDYIFFGDWSCEPQKGSLAGKI